MDKAKNRDDVLEKAIERETFVYPISAGFIDQKSVADSPKHEINEMNEVEYVALFS